MAQMKLDAARLTEAAEMLLKCNNVAVCDQMDKLAATLRPYAEDDQSNMLEKIIEDCVKVQRLYNETYKPALDSTTKEFIAHFDLAEEVAKLSAGDVTTSDAGFNVSEIDKGGLA